MTSLTGTGSMLRLALRRDRVMLPSWIAVLVLYAAVSVAGTLGIYPTVASRVQAAGAINDTPVFVALYGRIYDTTSLGAVAMIKVSGIGTALVAVLALLTLTRHTRTEEEAGRLDLLRATEIGRHAALTAGLLSTVGMSVVLGLVTAVALRSAGLPTAGSVAVGTAWAGTGIAFAGIGAVTTQLTRSARTANGIGVAVLVVAYLLRAVGDSAGPGGPGWLTWLSPIGWSQQVRPFAGERWWVLLLPLGFAVVAGCAGYVLSARRDLGSGLLPDRPGPAAGARSLRSPLALAWRLHRGMLLACLVGFVLIGAVVGGLAATVDRLLVGPQAQALITALGGAQSLTNAFLATCLAFLGIFAAAYGVQVAARLRSEELARRVEPLLATQVGRTRWAVSHLLVALAGSTVLMLGAGLTAGLAVAAPHGDFRLLGPILAGSLVQLPAAWVLIGVVLALFGLLPRLTAGGWVVLVAFLLIGEIGPLLKLSHWIMDLSPFTHLPHVPGGTVSAAPLLWLLAITAALITVGLAGLRRRDLA